MPPQLLMPPMPRKHLLAVILFKVFKVNSPIIEGYLGDKKAAVIKIRMLQ